MPSTEATILEGGYEIRSGSDLNLVSTFGNVEVAAAGGGVIVSGPTYISLVSSPASIYLGGSDAVAGTVVVEGGLQGNITMTSGPPLVGPTLQISPEKVDISVGPVNLGSRVLVTPLEISMRVGAVEFHLSATGIKMKVPTGSFELSLTGIRETFGPCDRELSLVGHTFTAAETNLEVGLVGQTYSGPITREKTEGVAQLQETLLVDTTNAIRKQGGAITMM